MKPRVLALDDERAAREAMSLRRILAEQAFSRAGGAPLVPGNTVHMYGAANVTGTGPFERTDTMTSGRAGLVWQPTERQSYYVAWGNAYNPSGELGVYGGTGNTNLNAINDDLGPEKTQNYEVGAQWDIGNVQLRSAVFRNAKTNARMVDDTGTTVLAGERRVDGVEIEVAGLITPNWEIYGGIAFMDGKIVKGAANVQGKTLYGNVSSDFPLSVRSESAGASVQGNLQHGKKELQLSTVNGSIRLRRKPGNTV